MKEFIGALNSYHVLNFLVPGVLLVFFLDTFSNTSLVQDNAFIGVFLYYFIGMVLSRIGSLLIEPIFKVLSIFNPYDYKDYIKASLVDSRISGLQEVSNMYRGLMSMSLVLLIIFIFQPSNLVFEGDNYVYAFFFLLIFIFSFAWQKQVGYISKNIDVLKENNFKAPENNKKRSKKVN